MSGELYKIISFYEFKDMSACGPLAVVRTELRTLFAESGVRGTLIIADEGYNGMVCGLAAQVDAFVERANSILKTSLRVRTTFHERAPFRRIDVKTKPEIVTLKRPVDMSLGEGTHVPPSEWDRLISDPKTLVLDTRNDYEYQTGTFRGSLNPGITKFSQLPELVSTDPRFRQYERVAMFCTGGIRCEKFAPYLRQIGFHEVYQLEGGILRYLDETDPEKSMWEGECFVFDERITVGHDLRKGSTPDLSQRTQNRKNPEYKDPK